MTTIASNSELRECYPQPLERSLRKSLTTLDAHMRHFISLSPFLCLGTSGADGADVTPRGDPPGFVRILDERTLLLPERPGNRLADSLRNVLGNPRVGLLFIVPGVSDTLRVNGRAKIVTDPELLEPCAVEGKTPKLGLLVMPGTVPLGALLVSRVEGIVAVAPDQYRVRESTEEHPAVQGFLKLTHRDGLIATVLNMDVVTQRIAWLKPRERTERTTHDE